MYEWIKALHVISVIAWMAGMLYLPRLYVYHADSAQGTEVSETLKIMERRLLRAIINPAMVAAFGFGGWMIYLEQSLLEQPWMWVKLGAVLVMGALHGAFSRWRRDFASDQNRHPARFYRFMNEAPTLLMVIIVVMVIVRPF
jgi:putative membrane protein